jgi:hypothetical protein
MSYSHNLVCCDMVWVITQEVLLSVIVCAIAPAGTNIYSSQKFANLEHEWPSYFSPPVNCHWVLTLKISIICKRIHDMPLYCWTSACLIIILNDSKMNRMIVSLYLPTRCEMHVAWNASGPDSLFWAQQHEFSPAIRHILLISKLLNFLCIFNTFTLLKSVLVLPQFLILE